MMAPSYKTLDDGVHQDTIEALAGEMHLPTERVAEIYTTELARLRVGARIEDYLVVLTCRRVRDTLRQQTAPARPFLRPESGILTSSAPASRLPVA